MTARARSVVALAPALALVVTAGAMRIAPAQPPPGYAEVAGSPDVILNPAHFGSRGSTFEQDCDNAVPPPQPGGLLWHFILPQSVFELEQTGQPGNIFASLSVTFANAGAVTLTTFGPPSSAHAWVYTDTDDTLMAGLGDLFRLNLLTRANEPNFNLSHTCFIPEVPPTTATPSTEPPTTTAAATTVAPATASPSTSVTPSTVPPGTVTPTTVPPPTSTDAGGGTTPSTRPDLPVTGSHNRLALGALFLLALGALLAVLARRPTAD